MKLYLHIGYPKTGTTAIQEFLSLNRGSLRQDGILYPLTGIVKFAHHDLPWVFRQDKRATPGLNLDGISQHLAAEVVDAEDAEFAIISSEGFVFMLQPEEVRNWLGVMFDEIIIMVWLRQPLRWIQSDYNQGVKGWRQLSCTYDEHICRVLKQRNSPMNYYYMLSRWADVFGWENLQVRSFDMEKYDLARGFMNAVGITDLSRYVEVKSKDSNPRLGLDEVEIMRVVNLKGFDHMRRNLIIKKLQAQSDNNKVRGFGCSASQKVVEKMNCENRKLLQYFDESLFEEDFFKVIVEESEVNHKCQLGTDDLLSASWPELDELLLGMKSESA